jgi:virginiamycin B lyase
MKIDKLSFWKTMLFLSMLVAVTATASLSQTPRDSPAAADYLYWTNYQNGSVGRDGVGGVNENFIPSVTGGAIGGASIALNGQYIYWASANGGTATTIARANLDGTDVDADFITGLQNPCGIAVNTTYIYWSNSAGTTIGRANLDGSDVNNDFIDTGGQVCGIALTSSHIYWSNYVTVEIGRANLNGSDVDLNFIPGGPGGVAIEGDYIYWTSNGGTGIGRAELNGTGVNQNFITGLNGFNVFLAVDSEYIFWANWDDSSGTTIGRAKLNGSDVNQSFIKNVLGPFGIAVTGGDPQQKPARGIQE